MKVCPNCGAEYQEQEESCPYCGFANEQFVQKQHEGRRKLLKRQREEILNLPKSIPKKSVRYLAIGGLILLGIFLLVVLAVFVGSKIKGSYEENQEQKNIAIMEEYLAQGDFEGLYEFYKELPYAYGVYDKYREVCDFYYQYTNMKWELDMYLEYRGLIDKEPLLEHLEGAMEKLRALCVSVEEAMQDNRRLSNEQYIEQLKIIGIVEFIEALQVDETVVEQILNAPQEENSPLYKELAEQVYENDERAE